MGYDQCSVSLQTKHTMIIYRAGPVERRSMQRINTHTLDFTNISPKKTLNTVNTRKACESTVGTVHIPQNTVLLRALQMLCQDFVGKIREIEPSNPRLNFR